VSARTASLRRRKLKELDCHSQVCTRAIARRGNVPAAAEVGWRVVGHGQRRLLLSLCVHLVSVSWSSTEDCLDSANRLVAVGDGGESPAQVRCSPVFLLMMRNSSLPEMPEPAWTKIHWFSSSYWSLVFVLWADTCQTIVPVVLLGWLALWRRGSVGLTRLTSLRRWCCHLSRQSRPCGLCSSRCGRCWVQSSQT
jgi:hypothetical protein